MRSERGVALIVAMMVVALVTAIATAIGFDYVVTAKRASNQVIAEQAYAYSLAAEALAVKVLRADLMIDQQTGAKDSLDEFWAQDAPPFQTEEGGYGGKLYDLAGRFNINNIRPRTAGAAGSGQNVLLANVHEARMYRLLLSLSEADGDFRVTEEDALGIVHAMVDWVDPDSEPTGIDGAEDDYYAGVENRPPQRVANRQFASTSELMLLAHMTPEIYKRLLPHVTVYPFEGGSININTATSNVLRALNVPTGTGDSVYVGLPATSEDVSSIITTQQTGGFTSKDAIKSGAFVNIDVAGLDVMSDYFLLDGHVVVGNLATSLQSVISRKGGYVQVIARSAGGF